jgi:hypothetical protein
VDETKSGVSLKINQNDKPTKKKTECCWLRTFAFKANAFLQFTLILFI